MLAGYTRSRNRLSGVSVDTSPNFLINANGLITGAANGDRPHQFKLAGTYILPWQNVVLSGGFGIGSGGAVTRQISRALAVGGSQTINLEPPGSHRLGRTHKADLRIGKQFKFEQRELELDVDFDNLTNASWVWQVRTQTVATNFVDGVTGERRSLPQFLAPTAILTPRTVVFRASFKF
jgi:hypothetical protein